MKTTAALALAAALGRGVSCQRLLQDVPRVGLGPLVRFSSDISSRFSGSGDASTIEDDLVELLEADDQVTVVGSVELGELLCESLENAEDAGALSFLILDNDNIIAEKTSYVYTPGDIFSDGTGRHVWAGVVVDPAQAEDEAVPWTVSMSWGEVCSVETFLLKVTKRNIDGTTNLVKTVPCEGPGTYTCLVETLIEFEESAEALIPEDAVFPGAIGSSAAEPVSATGTSSGNTGRSAASVNTSGRKLMTTTVIDVMLLYSEEAKLLLGNVSNSQIETTIVESLVWTNNAFVNSEVDVSVNPVYIGELPFIEVETDSRITLPFLRVNQDVNDLRDLYKADLVQMISGKMTFCGLGYLFISQPAYGYSIAKATCLDNFSHTHEWGHNLGCYHNRDSSSTDTAYAHGTRYCDAPSYRTIMGYSCAFFTPRVNYFSNPDVSTLDRVTGTDTENNARAIRDNMVAVSNYRGDALTPSPVALLTPAPSDMVTLDPVAVVTATPVDVPTPAPSDMVTLDPVAVVTATPVDVPTPAPSDMATLDPVAVATPTPVALLTPAPSDMVTLDPVAVVTATPVDVPTPAPSDMVTLDPVAVVTATPVDVPTPAPSDMATLDPVAVVTATPVDVPTPAPSDMVTLDPVAVVTATPVDVPTPAPLAIITTTPFSRPTPAPVDVPTPAPSALASPSPVALPTTAPVAPPTVDPVALPTPSPSDLPTGTEYSSLGCFGDAQGNRVLSGVFVKGDEEMTTEKCALFCQGFVYFGTEFADECFCGLATDDPARLGPSTCDFACAGDPSQSCGGRNAISVYRYETYPFLGCFGDSKGNRVLTAGSKKNDPTMTTEVCANLCAGFEYFGTEYGRECFCGYSEDDPTSLGPATCDYECAGNPSETCGGFNAISVYNYPDGYVAPPAPTGFLGCWKDSGEERIMDTHMTSEALTNEICKDYCTGFNFPLYGTQYGRECWCGSGDYTVYGQGVCDFSCSGDSSQTCGGYYAMSVWES